MQIVVGSYTSEPNQGSGISALQISESGLLQAPVLLAGVPDPSFVALQTSEGRMQLLAVQEQKEGQLAAWEFDVDHSGPETLAGAVVTSTGGAEPCHLAVLPSGRVAVANYGSGVVSLFSEGFSTGEAELKLLDSYQFTGSGPVASRQASSHAHQVVPTHYGTLLATDLGGDQIVEFDLSQDVLKPVDTISLPAGAGPRHLALTRRGEAEFLLVLGELDGNFHVYSRQARESSGDWIYRGSTPLATRSSEGESYPAHVELEQDVAYVSVRGQDQVSVFSLKELDDGGLPQLLQEAPTGGRWPRHFALAGGYLYSANQYSNSITVLPREPDGRLGEPVQTLSIGTPVALVIVRGW